MVAVPFRAYALDVRLNCRWMYSTRSSQFGRTRHSIPPPAVQPNGVAEDEALLNASVFDDLGHLAPLQDSVTVSASFAQAKPPVPYTSRLSNT